MLLALTLMRIGFFGQTGPLWVVLGFICMCVIIAILFKIVFLALPTLGVGQPWISIIYWVLVLLIFILFINYAFGFNWAQ
jgi:hypothetical protein